jgi:putative hydrolase of the HAD superfamily
MMRPSHVFLDFFGTLVRYNPSRRAQDHRGSHSLLASFDIDLGYADFLDAWGAVFSELDARSDVDDSEFSMIDGATIFIERHAHRSATPAEAAALAEIYMVEWNQGVVDIPGVGEMLEALSGVVTLAVVTNTHSPRLVPDHLARMGVDHLITDVITSVEVGWRKPHETIYREALGRVGARANESAFVGDTLDADHTGPRALGMQALLIDPAGVHPIEPGDRLEHILDLPQALGFGTA